MNLNLGSTEIILLIIGFFIAVVVIAISYLLLRRRAAHLKEERNRAQGYFDVAGVILVVIGPDETVLQINQKGCEILGYAEEEIVGKNWFDNFIPEKDRIETKKAFQKIISGELEAVKFHENPVLTKSGKEKEIFWQNTILKNKAGKITSTLSSGEDVSLFRQCEIALKKTEQEKSIILENMSECVLYQDREMKILWANEAAVKCEGIEPEQLIGKKCYEFWRKNQNQPCDGCPIAKSLITGKFEEAEITSPDNHIWQISGSPVKNENGEIIGIIHVASEITKKKKIEIALRESEEMYKTLLETSPDAVLVTDINGTITKISRRTMELYGTEDENDFIGKSAFIFLAPEEHLKAKTNFGIVIKKGILKSIEYKIPRQNGECLIGEISSALIKDNSGNPKSLIHTIRDITDRKQAEKEYQTIIGTSIDGFWINDMQGRFLDVNDAYCKLTGYSRDELLKMSITDIDALENPEETARHIKKIFDTGYDRFETKHRRKDGSAVEIEVSVKTGKDRIYSFLRDITDRKRTEKALKSSEKLLSNVFFSIQDGISVLDTEMNIVKVNPVLEQWYSHLMPIVGKKCYKAYRNQDEPCKDCPTYKTLQTGEIHKDIVPRKDHDGETVGWLDLFSYPLIDSETGEKAGVIEYLRDITTQKQALDALKDSEEKFRGVAEKSPNMIFINKKGKVVYANEKCEEIMGYKREEFYAPDFDFLSLTAPECVDMVKENFKKHISGEEIPPYEYVCVTKDGKKFETVLATKLINYGGDMAILGIITDISARKRMEEAIYQHNRELNTYNQIANIIGRSLDLSETLGAAFNKILELLEVESGTIHTYNTEQQELVLYYHSGMDEISLRMIEHIKSGEGVIGRAVKNRQPVWADQSAGAAIEPQLMFQKKRLRSIVSIPLLVHDRLLGVLTIGTLRAKTFTQREIEMLQSLAEQLALAIENSVFLEDKRRSEELYRSIFTITPVAIMTLDAKGLITTVSPYLSRVFGRGRTEDFIKKPNPFEKFLFGGSNLQSYFEQLFSMGKAFECSGCEGRGITGQHFYINIKAIPLFDDKANITGAIVVVENVTPRRKAEIAEQDIREFLENIINQSPIAMEVFDRYGTTIMVNPALIQLFHLSEKEDVIGKFNILGNKYLEEIRLLDSVKKAFAGETVNIRAIEIHARRYRGENASGEFIVDCKLFPIYDTQQKIRNIVCIYEDVTEKRKTERQVIRRSRELLAFNVVAKTLGQSLNDRDILEHTLDIVLEVMGLEIGAIYVMDDAANSLQLKVSRGLSEQIKNEFASVNVGSGIAGLTASTGEPFMVKDLSTDDRVASPTLRESGFHSFIYIPLKSKNRVYGVMPIGTRSFRDFTSDDLQLLISISNQIGVFLENVRLFQQAQRRAERETMVNKIVIALQSTLDLDAILRVMVNDLRAMLNVSRCSVFQMIDNVDGMTLTHESCLPAMNSGIGMFLPFAESPIRRLLQNNTALVIEDVGKELNFKNLNKQIEPYNIHSLILAPILVDNRLQGAILLAKDDTKRRWTETEINFVQTVASQTAIAIKNAKLFRREKESAVKLQNSLKELVKTNEELESFMYTVSHDLKTPVGAIKGLAAILRENLPESANQSAQNNLDRIIKNVDRMGVLIDDLLELCKIGKLETAKQKIDVASIIDSIEDDLLLPEKSVKLVRPKSFPVVTGDPEQIRQVFFNLIDNAVKFSEKQKSPKIEIGFTDLDDKIEFFVKDDGIGIDAKYYSRVFDVFYRIDPEKYSGAGIGLTIVKRTVENAGGEVRVESVTGKGSTFFFTLPKSE